MIFVEDEHENLVSKSISASGAIFNGRGYMNGYRLNSSGAIVASDCAVVTGYMPYTYGKTIKIEGGLSQANAGGQYIAAYDSSFALLYVNYLDALISNSGGNSVVTDDNAYIHTVKTSAFSNTAAINGFKSAAYIRISLAPCIGKKLKVYYT